MGIEKRVATHYARPNLEHAIMEALKASGRDEAAPLTPADLAAADEFHLGWRAATLELGRDLGLGPGMRVLDIGSGIGGPARTFAETHGCAVVGVDLTPEFVTAAEGLTRRCGLAGLVSFRLASALALPFPDAGFDAATLIHVGMNIEDKARLFTEARRTLKAGARFGVYDVMRAGEGEITYPVPWAASPQTSFVDSPGGYRRLLTEAGFAIESEIDRAALAIEHGRRMREKVEREGIPPLGLHILMGPATPERLGNVMAALHAGIIAPVQMIARAA
jgi:SAM-dependent methyltransferase